MPKVEFTDVSFYDNRRAYDFREVEREGEFLYWYKIIPSLNEFWWCVSKKSPNTAWDNVTISKQIISFEQIEMFSKMIALVKEMEALVGNAL